MTYDKDAYFTACYNGWCSQEVDGEHSFYNDQAFWTAKMTRYPATRQRVVFLRHPVGH